MCSFIIITVSAITRRFELVPESVMLFATDAPPVRVLSESTAFLMTSLLSDVIDAGTGAGARRLGFKAPAAGK